MALQPEAMPLQYIQRDRIGIEVVGDQGNTSADVLCTNAAAQQLLIEVRAARVEAEAVGKLLFVHRRALTPASPEGQRERDVADLGSAL